MPAEAKAPCSLPTLPPRPSRKALEDGYVERGAALVACETMRALAVSTHESEHVLEMMATTAQEKRKRRGLFGR